MYDHILVPTDGSESAEHAASAALVFADAYDAALHALSVVDERDYGGVLSDETAVEAGMSAAESVSRAAVASVAELAGERPVQTHVANGVPVQTILDFVEDGEIELVVMGTHGRTGVKRLVIGSVAERVVRFADVPVLTVRLAEEPPDWPPIRRLLVPTDGSDASFSAIPHALDIAERFGASLSVLYVLDERSKSAFYNVGTALEDVVGGLERAGEEATSRVEARAEARGIDVTSSVVAGLPSQSICAHAESTDADLVVMASHGRTGLSHHLLGSVAERVVRNATVPVLTTPVDPGAD